MALHNELGKEGEYLAAAWLKENGFSIIHANWRFSYYEIDIIALKNNLLHFIEVKSRKWSGYGYPEDSVTRKKFRRLQQAADQYLFLNPGHQWISYDILAITLYNDQDPEFFLIEDVFW